MKFFPLISASLIAFSLPAAAAQHITVIGDSLSKEYEITFPGVHSFVTIEGIDEENPGARNWAEILHQKRNAHFDLGLFRNTLLVDMYSDTRLLGHEYNWAIPGATSRALRLLLTDPNAAELATDPDISTLISFAGEYKQVAQRMTTQMQTTSAAAVIWCGGNDLRYGSTDPAANVGGTRITYGTIYEGNGTTGTGNPVPLMNSIRDNIKTIGQFVKTANPSLPIVIIGVPHIGCAPEVKDSWPTDPVRTQRLTTAIQALNTELKTWTESTLGGVFVDIFPATVGLISSPVEMGGIQFSNTSDTNGLSAPASAHNRFVFSHDGFHPITPFQGRVAQMVQAALRVKSPAVFGSSPPLGDRELIREILTVPARTGFDEFMAASGAPAALRGENADPDGDGLSNLVEFTLAGNHPWSGAAPSLPVPQLVSTPAPALALTWMPAYQSNIFAGVAAQQSANLTAWTDVPAGQVTLNGDGSLTARVPQAGNARVFMQLKVTAQP